MIRAHAPWLVAAGAVALAALYPATALVGGPAALPALLLAIAIFFAILRHTAIAIAIALVLVPFTNWIAPAALPQIGGANQPIQLVLLPLLAAGAAVAALMHRPARPVPASPLALLIVAFLATTALAALHTPETEGARTEFLMIGIAGVLALATLQICDRPRDVAFILAGVAVGGVLAGAQGVLQAAAGVTDTPAFEAGGEYVNRVQGSFLHPNRYGSYLAMVAPFGALLALYLRRAPWVRLVALAGAVAAVPGLMVSYSRTAMVGMAAGTIAWLLLVRPRLALAASLAGAVAVVALAPANLVERFQDAPGSDEVIERVAVWEASVRLFSERPVAGTGLDGFRTGFASLSDESAGRGGRLLLSSEGGPALPTHAHNIYLQVATEQGLIGLTAFVLLVLGVLGGCLAGARRSRDPDVRAVCIAVGAAWATWLALGLADAKLYEEHGILLLVAAAAAARMRAMEAVEDGLDIRTA